MRVHAFDCGWLTGAAAGFLAGEPGRLRVPVPVFAIEHPRGVVVFDSGLHPVSARDPASGVGRAAPFFTVELGDDEAVDARLRAVGIDPADVRWLVTSHLHFDHVGGHARLPNATVVVQRAEWDAAHDDALAHELYYERALWDLGHPVQAVAGEHDLFGDGRVVCVPTPGHTPGHQSLRLAGDDGTTVVLTADACYLRRTLDEDRLPLFSWDADALRTSLSRLRRLRDAGARLVYGHDPDAWPSVPKTLAALG